jgi:polyisoprenoid-binding protein YceI
MKKFKILLPLLLAAFTGMSQTYTPTDASSKVSFVIKNFGVKTNGTFTGLKGAINFDPKNLAASSFNVSVNASSVNTSNDTRDKHLRKSEYFNAEKFALITYVSTKITESTVAGRYFVVGNLTIKGVSKMVQFGFSATPADKGYVFTGSFDINRRDFGVGGSSISMSDNLKVTLQITATK